MPDGTAQLSTDRLIGTLIERTESMTRELGQMNAKLDNIGHSNHARVTIVEGRITALEMKWAQKDGSSKMAAIVFGSAATIGGLVATVVGFFFKGYWN